MSGHIAVIYEGNKREAGYWKSLQNSFFKDSDIRFIDFPAGENVYMLWKRLNEDGFDTDIIEVIREYDAKAACVLGELRRDDFQEVYLFFDYDPHHNDLSIEGRKDEVLLRMLKDFNNETENGKLYISYPMCEALRDFICFSCKSYSDCFVKLDDIGRYKHITGISNPHSDWRKYDRDIWKTIISVFLVRCKCLHGYSDSTKTVMEDLIKWYKENASTVSIHDIEADLLNDEGVVFVLSSFPQFILDYYKPSFWSEGENVLPDIEMRHECMNRQSYLTMLKNFTKL